MKILLFTPDHPETNIHLPVQRMLVQYGVVVDRVVSSEQCEFLAMTDRYTAILVVLTSQFTRTAARLAQWKTQGCTSLCIVLSSRQSGLERAQALQSGIDAYYIEPYSYSKLLISISLAAYRQVAVQDIAAAHGFSVDVLARTILYGGTPLVLTRTEFDLLSLFVRHQGAVLTRVQIWEEVWGNKEYPLANTIDVHIGRLRQKLKKSGAPYPQTVHGIGYRLSSIYPLNPEKVGTARLASDTAD